MHYRKLEELYHLIPQAGKLKHIMDTEEVRKARGSNHNHQAWEGGYVHHITEVLNTAIWLYSTSPRPLPFDMGDALLVLFLHDLEKPFKTHAGVDKESRRAFRDTMIEQNHIALTPQQKNALRYVEGEYDDYSNTKRRMEELAAFCNMCDIASARLWPNEGKKETW